MGRAVLMRERMKDHEEFHHWRKRKATTFLIFNSVFNCCEIEKKITQNCISFLRLRLFCVQSE